MSLFVYVDACEFLWLLLTTHNGHCILLVEKSHISEEIFVFLSILYGLSDYTLPLFYKKLWKKPFELKPFRLLN